MFLFCAIGVAAVVPPCAQAWLHLDFMAGCGCPYAFTRLRLCLRKHLFDLLIDTRFEMGKTAHEL
jgi:hypothetical protein